MRPPLSAVGKKHGRITCVKGFKELGFAENTGGTAEILLLRPEKRKLFRAEFIFLEEKEND